MRQTAIECLEQELERLGVHLFDEVQEAIEKAKEIERHHIEQSFNHGRNVGRDGSPGVDGNYYYKKTFKEE